MCIKKDMRTYFFKAVLLCCVQITICVDNEKERTYACFEMELLAKGVVVMSVLTRININHFH